MYLYSDPIIASSYNIPKLIIYRSKFLVVRRLKQKELIMIERVKLGKV